MRGRRATVHDPRRRRRILSHLPARFTAGDACGSGYRFAPRHPSGPRQVPPPNSEDPEWLIQRAALPNPQSQRCQSGIRGWRPAGRSSAKSLWERERHRALQQFDHATSNVGSRRRGDVRRSSTDLRSRVFCRASPAQRRVHEDFVGVAAIDLSWPRTRRGIGEDKGSHEGLWSRALLTIGLDPVMKRPSLRRQPLIAAIARSVPSDLATALSNLFIALDDDRTHSVQSRKRRLASSTLVESRPFVEVPLGVVGDHGAGRRHGGSLSVGV